MKKLLLNFFAVCLASASMATIHVVQVDNFKYTPNNITVNVGDTVRWVWNGGSHSTTCDPAVSSAMTLPAGAPTWNAPMNSGNTTFDYKVTVAGAYHYHCIPHGNFMSGDITAQAVCTPPGIASATATGNPICPGTTTTLTANGVTGTNATIAWMLNGNNVGSGASLPNAGAGTYTAVVSACNTTAQKSVTVNAVNTWTGDVGNGWNSGGNWECGVAPAAGDNVDIPAIPSQPFLTTPVTVGNITYDNVIHLNGQSLTVNGSISGPGAITGSSTSSLMLNGNAGVVHFTPGPTNSILKMLQLNTGANATVGGDLKIMGP